MKSNKDNQETNPFKLINQIDELPAELKREVMGTIKFAHLAADIGKLFSVDMAMTAGKILDPESDI